MIMVNIVSHNEYFVKNKRSLYSAYLIINRSIRCTVYKLHGISNADSTSFLSLRSTSVALGEEGGWGGGGMKGGGRITLGRSFSPFTETRTFLNPYFPFSFKVLCRERGRPSQ